MLVLPTAAGAKVEVSDPAPMLQGSSLGEPFQGIDGLVGEVIITKLPNGTFTWKLEAHGLEPGHAYSIWVGNFEALDGLDFAAPGGGGGIVGGSGSVVESGNHCLWPLNQDYVEGEPIEEIGGFRPGTAPDCNFVDPDHENGVWFVLEDHGPWESGDMIELWSPGGFAANNPFVIAHVPPF